MCSSSSGSVAVHQQQPECFEVLRGRRAVCSSHSITLFFCCCCKCSFRQNIIRTHSGESRPLFLHDQSVAHFLLSMQLSFLYTFIDRSSLFVSRILHTPCHLANYCFARSFWHTQKTFRLTHTHTHARELLLPFVGGFVRGNVDRSA